VQPLKANVTVLQAVDFAEPQSAIARLFYIVVLTYVVKSYVPGTITYVGTVHGKARAVLARSN
jgi:hypothetical protein